MQKGEGSGSISSGDDIWAKLVPLDSSYSDIELKCNEATICSEIKSSSNERKEWCTITKQKDQASAVIQNKSSCSILVDGTIVEQGDTTVVRCGSEIIPGPESEGFMRYMFKAMPSKEISKKTVKINTDPEHTKCSICLNVWHNVVTVAPCFHNFCNGCFSEWLKRCQERHASVLCPQCRAVVQSVARNPFLHAIEEAILESYPSLRRSNEETAVLDSYSLIKSPLVVCNARKLKRRVRARVGEEYPRDFQCPQCNVAYAGFQCNQSTTHLQCHACGGMMPSRSNSSISQHCVGCDRAFCGAYWQALGVTTVDDAYQLCSPETLKPISDHSVTRIPFLAHEKNRHEQDITEKCIRQMGKSLQDVVLEGIRKMGNREIDRTMLQLNHSEMITPQTHVCSECYDKLVSFLLYWFRITLPKHYLPPEAIQREDCWYGYACRTQHHNEEHARKRNHVCRPTRGNQTS